MSEEQHKATLSRWERKREAIEEADRAAVSNMKKVITTALQNPETRRNMAKELLFARQNRTTMRNREGFGDDGEIITGLEDDSFAALQRDLYEE